MSQDWFDNLDVGHPLSEDERDSRSVGRVSVSKVSSSKGSARESASTQSGGMMQSPQMMSFFYYLKLYSYDLLKSVHAQAKSFFDRQATMGIPVGNQKSLRELFCLSLDYCVEWPPHVVQQQIDYIMKEFEQVSALWPKAFTLFLLHYYDREESALAATRAKGVGHGKIFPNLVVRCPGEVKIVQPPFQDFVVSFIRYLVNYAPIRNDSVVREERYHVMDDAINFAMLQTMIDIANRYTECIMDTSVLEITLKDRGEASRPEPVVRVDARDGRSVKSVTLPPEGYFRGVSMIEARSQAGSQAARSQAARSQAARSQAARSQAASQAARSQAARSQAASQAPALRIELRSPRAVSNAQALAESYQSTHASSRQEDE